MKKHIYQLIINQGRKTPKPVMASFGNNHRIEIHIRNTGIMILTASSAHKDPEGILNGKDFLFGDVLKKALLLYVICYNRFLDIKKACVMIDNSVLASYSKTENGVPLVYSLSEGRLKENFSSVWNTAGVMSMIACTSGSSYDGRFTALHALLAAKSDRYEIERFTYYWMAMNGLYNFVATEGKRLLQKHGSKESLEKEYRKQGFMIRCYGHEPFRPNGKDDHQIDIHGRQILWHILPVIRTIPQKCIDEFCNACISSDLGNEYVQRIDAAIDRMNEKCGYNEHYPVFPLMVIWLPYKIRCGSFHGENALPTFCYSDDSLLKVLRVINRLLDRFLTAELPLWLSADEDVAENRKRRLEKAAKNPAYKTMK